MSRATVGPGVDVGSDGLVRVGDVGPSSRRMPRTGAPPDRATADGAAGSGEALGEDRVTLRRKFLATEHRSSLLVGTMNGSRLEAACASSERSGGRSVAGAQ